MNNKTKIMLGLSVLTAGTLAAGATGTLAWFTTNKTATATYKNITAVGTQGNIKAAITTLNGDVADNTNGAAVTVANSTAKISDVSSNDGITFYQPDWKGAAGNGTNIEFNKINTVTGVSGYYLQYLVTITNQSEDDVADNTVKLDLSGITIDGEATLANWTRVALNLGVKKTTDGKFLEKDDTKTDEQKTFVIQNDIASGNCRFVNPNKENHGSTMGSVLDDVEGIKKASAIDSTNAIEIASSLAKGATISVGVSVWLEGTMADTQETAKGKAVNVSLTFTASSTTK